MLTKKQVTAARRKTIAMLNKSKIAITTFEKNNIEVADFGLGRLNDIGLEIVLYVNTSRCCAKELVLFPGQTCPEHRHPDVSGEVGKEETFRCRFGKVYLYVPGKKTNNPGAIVPKGKAAVFTVWKEIVLNPGEQYTLKPNTLHWFQAGKSGAVVSEFSTKSRDGSDIFTDKEIQRIPKIK